MYMKSSKLLYKLVLLFLASTFAFQSCVDFPEDIILPNWEIELNLPLTEDTFVLDSILDFEENIEIIEEGGVRIYGVQSDDYIQEFSTSQFLEGKLNGSFDPMAFPIATGDTIVGIDLPSGAEIDTAHLKRGQIVFNINNTSSETVNLEIIFPALLREVNGNFESYRFAYSLAPNENLQNQTVQISDFRYSTRAQSQKGELQVRVIMNAQPTLDEIELDFSINNSDFYYMKGTVPPLTLDPVREGVELPLTDDAREARDQLFFKDAIMTMRAEYDGPIPSQDVFSVHFTNVKMQGVRNDGTSFSMTNQNGEEILDDIIINNGVAQVEFSPTNSNIADFLSFIPDSIIVEGEILMNPDGQPGAASDVDKVVITLNITSKSKVVIDSDPFVTSEPLEIDEEIREDSFDDIKGAILYFEIINGIPLDVSIEMEFQTENGDSLFVKNLMVERAVMNNPDDVFSVQESSTSSQLQLNEEEIQMLKNSYLIEVSWIPNTRDERPYAYFGPDMEVYFKSWFTLNYLIDGEDI